MRNSVGRVLGGGLAALALATQAESQTVQGRVLELESGSPIVGALVSLVDAGGREVGRAASTPSGGYQLRAPSGGRYSVVVYQIGRQPWRSPAFSVSGGIHPLTPKVDAQPYQLPPISVEVRRPHCGVRLDEGGVLGDLLATAGVALQLAEVTAKEGRLTFATQTYLKRHDPAFRLVDSVSTGSPGLARWPIESATPESLEVWGFVRETPRKRRVSSADALEGPVYYGPDARVLFSDWFLATHCFRVAEERGELLEVRFTPEHRESRVEILGRLVLDRRSLELRRVEFEYVGLPRWVPGGKAGGTVELRRLPSGAWVPSAWQLLAPQPARLQGTAELRLHGWIESGGRVTSVREREGGARGQ